MRTRLRRRQVLTTGAAVAAGTVLATGSAVACRTTPATTLDVTRAESLGGDLAQVALLAALDNAAVVAYDAMAERIGELRDDGTTVSEVVADLLGATREHHRRHAEAWGRVLDGLGRGPVVERDLTYGAELEVAVNLAVTERDLASTATGLETVLAATGLAALGALVDQAALEAVATIQPVEAAHAALLAQVAGAEPTPSVILALAPARPLTDVLG